MPRGKHPSYTAKTLKLLRDRGFRADIVERRCGPIKRDYLGIIDIIAIKQGVIIGVQSTSYAAKKKHEDLIAANTQTLALWLGLPGAKFILVFWKKEMVGKRVKYVSYAKEYLLAPDQKETIAPTLTNGSNTFIH